MLSGGPLGAPALIANWYAQPDYGVTNLTTAGITFGYAGYVIDPETSLYKTATRYYEPRLGRFPSPDPLRQQGGLNLYAYVNDDPLNRKDPSDLLLGQVGSAAWGLVENHPLATAGAVGTIIVAGACAVAEPCGAIVGGAIGLGGAAEGSIVAAEEGLTAAEQLAVDRAAGAAFEQAVGANLEQSGLSVGEQIKIETQSGMRARLDFLPQEPLTGEIGCIECKASPTAPLTPNQTLAFPEIGQTGGTIVGAGKPGFPGGMQLPPAGVQIIRGP